MDFTQKDWWKSAITYEIYPRSFMDSNDDGIGDLQGIIQKLDYLQSLGIDVLWLCPFFKSPMDDMGYDISDFCDIDPIFGTLKDFDQLLQETEKRGMGIMMDLVMNHCSDEHHWFTEACKSVDNPYHDYFIWTDKPNNWQSIFRGSCWEYVPTVDRYYLHIFSKKQPDLNWNNPRLREEMKNIMRFWLDKGVKALRFDAITAICKPAGFPDCPPNVEITDFISFGEHLPQWLDEIYQDVLSHYNVATVGEGPPQGSSQLSLITGDDKCLQALHVFGAISQDVRDGELFKKWAFEPKRWYDDQTSWISYIASQNIWNTSFIQNHDHPRIVTRYGNDTKFWAQSAILWGVWNLTQKASIYLYQGEELGMRNYPFSDINEFQDIQILNLAGELEQKGDHISNHWDAVLHRARDNARTPMQWDKDLPFYGFSTQKPWLNVNDNHIDAKTSPVLLAYQQLIKLRKQYDALALGEIEFEPYMDNNIICYHRVLNDQKLTIILNFGNIAQDYTYATDAVLFNNYQTTGGKQLKPWQALIIDQS